MDAAYELVLADPHGDPVGLRHFGSLMLLHNEVMSGVAAPLIHVPFCVEIGCGLHPAAQRSATA